MMGPEGSLRMGEIPRFVEDVGASGSSLLASARGRRTIPPGANAEMALEEGQELGGAKKSPVVNREEPGPKI